MILRNKPLVRCITNFVTVNDCANILLAAGGSPTMAMDIREVEEAVAGVQALVCNLGAIEAVEAMVLAGKEANRLDIPVVFDPVAAGGTRLRRESARRLLEEVHFSVIRGNASELRFLSGREASGVGVDVGREDGVTEENLEESITWLSALAGKLGTVVALSGSLDVISDGNRSVVLRNGCATMARVTGTGCMLSALMGGFCGEYPQKPLWAAVSAGVAMGISGELAEVKRLENQTGNATFRNDLIDAMFNLSEDEIRKGARYEVFKR